MTARVAKRRKSKPKPRRRSKPRPKALPVVALGLPPIVRPPARLPELPAASLSTPRTSPPALVTEGATVALLGDLTKLKHKAEVDRLRQEECAVHVESLFKRVKEWLARAEVDGLVKLSFVGLVQVRNATLYLDVPTGDRLVLQYYAPRDKPVWDRIFMCRENEGRTGVWLRLRDTVWFYDELPLDEHVFAALFRKFLGL